MECDVTADDNRLTGWGLLIAYLPASLHPFLSTFDRIEWAQYYEDKNRLKVWLMLGLFGVDGTKALTQEFKDASPSERKGLKADFTQLVVEELNGLDEEIDRLDGVSIPELAAGWTEEERKTAIEQTTMLSIFLMTHICNYLALMSFGRTMCDLVRLAKEGDDEAFCHAVQIDRTVLFGVNYFRQRLICAQVGCQPDFLHKLGEAIKGPILRKKMSYPELMLVFAMLDDEGLLDMPLEKLLDVCEDLGVYGREHGVEDVNSLGKRRQYYRKMTGSQKRI